MAAFSPSVNASSSLVSGDLHAESLPLIDLRLLSQSELLSLSVCSSTFPSVHSLHSDTDLSTPRIDRSVFNESAGSRKQTFSRLRLAPRGSTTTTSSSASVSTSNPSHRQISDAPIPEESRQIVSRLKSLFGVVDSGCDDKNLVSVPVQFHESISSLPNTAWALPIARMETANSGCSLDIEQPVALLAGSVNSGGTKRKRGRPRKTKDENQAVLMPNGNGVSANYRLGSVKANAETVEVAAAFPAVDDPNGIQEQCTDDNK